MSADPQLTTQLLHALADAPGGVSLSKLCKQLGVRMSVLLRTLAWLGEAPIGGCPGPGWVLLQRHGERELAVLSARGRAALMGKAPSP
ncbi:hypothetical protein ACDH70_22030 [Xanthomonas axonopodis pv. poinsettiicola]|uniref:hypothetical protein n=1 Tax=Xanthomonas TaxID=338 RepID=UPI001E51755E|nr:hypothetical protein [Xanthomonas codiaei]MCC8538811.1 hypothetical protein [Xanthomonas codiaei]